MSWQIECADVLDWAAGYTGEPFHAILADAPYHLKGGFMNKDWDRDGPDAISFNPETWKALGQHLLPGAFMMVFGGARTYHRMAVAIEDAGFILHPAIVWVTGSSFPKATRIDTQVDKAAGAEREVVGTNPNVNGRISGGIWAEGIERPWKDRVRAGDISNANITAPATPLPATWAGHRYGLQALKPAAEFICVAQKPYHGRPVDNIMETGAGALWVDGGRIGIDDDERNVIDNRSGKGWGTNQCSFGGRDNGTFKSHSQGRWPSNFVLSHLPTCRKVGTRRVKLQNPEYRNEGKGGTRNIELGPGSLPSNVGIGYADPDGLEIVDVWECTDGCPVRALGEQSGERQVGQYRPGTIHGHYPRHKYQGNGSIKTGAPDAPDNYGDTGTAARFFFQATWEYEIAERLAQAEPFYYCAKASRRERDAGLENLPMATGHVAVGDMAGIEGHKTNVTDGKRHNPHPTVKPIALTRYLATLLLPPAAYAPRRILIPFAGVGSEMIGAGLAGWEEVTGIEREVEYVEIGQARLKHWLASLQMELTL